MKKILWVLLTFLASTILTSCKSIQIENEAKTDKRPFRPLAKVSLGRLGPNLTLLRQGVLMLQGSEAATGSV